MQLINMLKQAIKILYIVLAALLERISSPEHVFTKLNTMTRRFSSYL